MQTHNPSQQLAPRVGVAYLKGLVELGDEGEQLFKQDVYLELLGVLTEVLGCGLHLLLHTAQAGGQAPHQLL